MVAQTPAVAPNEHLLCHVLAPVGRTGDHPDTELWLVDTDAGIAQVQRLTLADDAATALTSWRAGVLDYLSMAK